MAQRYVRVQSKTGQLHYGLLQPDRSVKVLDAPPWLQGQLTDAELIASDYTLLAPCAPSKVIARREKLCPARPKRWEVPPPIRTAAVHEAFYSGDIGGRPLFSTRPNLNG